MIMEVWTWNRSTSLPRVKQCSIFYFFTLCIDCYVITVYKGKMMPLNGKEAWFSVDPWQNPDSIISFIWPVRDFPVQLEGALICNDHSTCGRVWHQNWTLPPWVAPYSAQAPICEPLTGLQVQSGLLCWDRKWNVFLLERAMSDVLCTFIGAKHHLNKSLNKVKKVLQPEANLKHFLCQMQFWYSCPKHESFRFATSTFSLFALIFSLI